MPESKTTSCHLTLDVLVNSIDFLLDIDILGRKLTDIAQVLDRLLPLPLSHQPSGALDHPERPRKEHSGWDELHGKGNEPLGMI